MDYNKIGNLIANERKAKNLTQAKLAEQLFVSEKTVSKWETGKGVPDTNSLPLLCEIFNISINELLNGERLTSDKYTTKAEETLLTLQTDNELTTKRLLKAEIILGLYSTFIFLSLLFTAIYFIEKMALIALPTVLIVVGVVLFFIGISFCIYIEQKAGFYICDHCKHKYVPTYKKVFCARHIGRSRYMKCPHCKKYSWNKKVVK